MSYFMILNQVEHANEVNKLDNSTASKTTTCSVLNIQHSEEEVSFNFKVAAVTVFGPNGEKVHTFAVIDDAYDL